MHIAYKNQEAFKKLRESFHRSPPQKVWLATKIISRRSVESTGSEAVMRSLRLGGLAEKRKAAMTENAIAKEIVDAAFRIHTTLGPGLLESVYQTVLAYELAGGVSAR